MKLSFKPVQYVCSCYEKFNNKHLKNIRLQGRDMVKE
ncbi:hypothetical protein Psfp_03593 [Pelotomaculum sp. FP]|nr:hypothetical protein Psfp_03593 [Pelotomaculum sp. FP]